MKSVKATALIAALSLYALPAMAVYKCQDEAGKTVYQDKPCHAAMAKRSRSKTAAGA